MAGSARYPGARRHEAKAGVRGTCSFRSLSVLRELRATGAGDPRRYANPRSTRVRQAPPQREDVDVPSRRPTTPSGWEGLERSQLPSPGWRRGRERSGGVAVGGTKEVVGAELEEDG